MVFVLTGLLHHWIFIFKKKNNSTFVSLVPKLALGSWNKPFIAFGYFLQNVPMHEVPEILSTCEKEKIKK